MKNAINSLLATVVIGAGIVFSSTGIAAATGDRSFWLSNEGRGDIYSLRISPSDGTEFSIDLLGDEVVEAGDDAYLIEPRGFRRTCVFDIEITKANGFEIMLWEVDLCEVSDVVVDGRQAEAF